jgi:hypothetical protein
MKINKKLLIEAAKYRPKEYLEDVYSYVDAEDTEYVYISSHNYYLLRDKYTSVKPGTELKKLISWFPLLINKECKHCKSLEIKMNQWGIERCIEKKKYIITKLMINAKRNKIPTTEFILSTLLNRAIRNAKRLDNGSNNRT